MTTGDNMHGFFKELATQRWDDHRYYHHSRINQSLHLLSALSFLVAYGLLFVDPPMAALVAWLIGMTTRQAGHFFFEPKGYDHVNEATHEYKEEVKVGYNLQRKVVLMGMWALFPAAAAAQSGAVRPSRAAQRLDRLCAQRRHDLAGVRRARASSSAWCSCSS